MARGLFIVLTTKGIKQPLYKPFFLFSPLQVALSAILCGVVAAPSRPIVVPDLPVVHAPVAVVTSQSHAQDEIGQYSYSYSNPLSSKVETKTIDGVTRGGYSYLDSHGHVQNVNYVSDDVSLV